MITDVWGSTFYSEKEHTLRFIVSRSDFRETVDVSLL